MMLRAALALLTVIAAWEPAAAAALARTASPGGAPASVFCPLAGGWRGRLAPAEGLRWRAPGLRPASPVPHPAFGVQTGISAAAPVSAVPAGRPPSSAEQISAAASAVSGVVLAGEATAPVEDGGVQAGLDRVFDGREAAGSPPVSAGGWRPTSWMAALWDAPAAARAEKRSVLPLPQERLRAARRTLAGSGIYKIGMEALGISMPLIALTVFGSAVWLATMAAGWGASMTLSSMLAGGLIDRRPVQKVMAVSLLAQAALGGAMIGLLGLGLANPWLLLPLYSLAGAAQGVMLTARDCLPARILGRDEAVLGAFNAKNHIVYEIAGSLAPLLIGTLIAKFGVVAGLFLQPPAYLLAAVTFWRVRLDGSAQAAAAAPARGQPGLLRRAVADLREGARVMLGSREFRWLGALLLGPMVLHRVVEQMLIPVFAKSVLGAPEQAAWLICGSNSGELLGGILVLWALMRAKGGEGPSALRWLRPMALGGLAVWAFAGGAGLWLILPLVAAMSVTWAANDISLAAYFQSRLPNASAGKAVGFLLAAELGLILVLSYLLGFVFEWLPLSAGLTGVSVAFSVMAALFFLGYSRLKALAVSRRADRPS